MSAFDDFDAEISAIVEAEFGDVAVFSPQISGEFTASQADPSRPQRSLTGVFSSGPVSERAYRGEKPGSGAAHERFAQSATLWVSAANIATLPYDLAPGDAVAVRGMKFTISEMMATDRGDIEFGLIKDHRP